MGANPEYCYLEETMRGDHRIILLILLPVVSLGMMSCSVKEDLGEKFSAQSVQIDKVSLDTPTIPTLTILRLKHFVDYGDQEVELALDEDQVVQLLPILVEWKDSYDNDPSEDPGDFISRINTTLRQEQCAFMPSKQSSEDGLFVMTVGETEASGSLKSRVPDLLQYLIDELSDMTI